MAKLCGVKVVLAFSDLYQGVHYFSTEHSAPFNLSTFLQGEVEEHTKYNYTLDDVPAYEAVPV